MVLFAGVVSVEGISGKSLPARNTFTRSTYIDAELSDIISWLSIKYRFVNMLLNLVGLYGHLLMIVLPYTLSSL